MEKEHLKFSAEVEAFVSRHELPESVARKFFSFPASEREILVTLLDELVLNQNKIKEMLEALNDISKRDGLKASDILKNCLEKVEKVLEAPVRVQQVREMLAKQRRPRLEKKKQEFEEIVRHLKLPLKAQLNSSPYFEDAFVELKVRLSSIDDLTDLKKSLENSPTWEKLFSIL
jgi:hypothetical protein